MTTHIDRYGYVTEEEALKVFKDENAPPLEWMKAFQFLMEKHPQFAAACHEEMRGHLGVDKLQPAAFDLQGKPLYTPEDVTDWLNSHGCKNDKGQKLTVQDINDFVEEMGYKQPDLPDNQPATTLGGVYKGKVIKQVVDGEELDFGDGRIFMRFLAHEVKEGNSKAIHVLNKFCGLARQHGASDLVLTRLKEAAKRDGDGGTYLKWLDRASKHFADNTFMEMVLRGLV